MNGVEMIEAERQRQLDEEGFTNEHDDQHTAGELAIVAACFASPVQLYCYRDGVLLQDIWPDTWHRCWDKRGPDADRIELLAKAGALIAAEIDRLKRRKKHAE